MPSTDLVARWRGSAFNQEGLRWVDDVLTGRGSQRTSELAPHKIRFWAGVFSADTTHGRVWFKVANPGQAFEGELLQALGRLRPAEVMVPLAVDGDRGWWLLPDGGPTLSESSETEHTWVDLLTQVAATQRAVSTERASLSMVPALPSSAASAYIEALIDDLVRRPQSDPQAIDTGEARSLTDGLSMLDADMALLDSLGIPDTLQINDAHTGNACGPARAGGPPRLFDLGDAFWSHPFAVLHLPMRVVSGVGLADPLPTSPAAEALASAYLRQWPEVDAQHGPEILRSADRLGSVHRAASWARLLREVSSDCLGMAPPRLVEWVRQAVSAN